MALVKLWAMVGVALFVTSCKKTSSNDTPAAGGSAAATPPAGSSSSGEKPKRDLAAIDPCTLLTVAEIEAALSKPKPGIRDKNQCVWNSEAQTPDF